MNLESGLVSETSAFIRRLGPNSAWLLLSRLGGLVFSALTAIFIARALGPAGLGGYAYLTSVILVGNVLTTFGLDTLLIRDLARSRDLDSPLLPGVLWLQLGLSAIFISALLLASWRIPHLVPDVRLALQLYSLALLALAFYTTFSAVLRAYERMDLFNHANLVVAALQSAGVWLALRLHANLVTVAWILLASQALGAITAGWLCARKIGRVNLALKLDRQWVQLIFNLLRRSWSLAFLGGLAVISGRLGVLLLAWISGQVMAGNFSAAMRLVEMLKLGHYAYFGALLPVLAQNSAFKRDRKQAIAQGVSKRMLRLSFTILLLASALIAAMLAWFAEPIIAIIYGPVYGSSVALLRVLAWSLVPYTISAQLSLNLVASGLEKRVLVATTGSIGLAVLAYLALVPRFGLYGSGLASLAGETAAAILLVLLSCKRRGSFYWILPWANTSRFRKGIRREIYSS